jgi:hypothetical protein
VNVRRALVERVLELLAGDGPGVIADGIGAAIAESYERRLNIPTPATQAEALVAEVAGARLVAVSLAQAQRLIPTGSEPTSLPAILANKAARERIASGRIQMFAAQQATLCELLAYSTANRRPSDADRVAAVLAEVAKQRQVATHIFGQLYATERAMVRLWLLAIPSEESEGQG